MNAVSLILFSPGANMAMDSPPTTRAIVSTEAVHTETKTIRDKRLKETKDNTRRGDKITKKTKDFELFGLCISGTQTNTLK